MKYDLFIKLRTEENSDFSKDKIKEFLKKEFKTISFDFDRKQTLKPFAILEVDSLSGFYKNLSDFIKRVNDIKILELSFYSYVDGIIYDKNLYYYSNELNDSILKKSDPNYCNKIRDGYLINDIYKISIYNMYEPYVSEKINLVANLYQPANIDISIDSFEESSRNLKLAGNFLDLGDKILFAESCMIRTMNHLLFPIFRGETHVLKDKNELKSVISSRLSKFGITLKQWRCNVDLK